MINYDTLKKNLLDGLDLIVDDPTRPPRVILGILEHVKLVEVEAEMFNTLKGEQEEIAYMGDMCYLTKAFLERPLEE